MKNLETLQVFRGLAAMLVLLFHANGTFRDTFNEVYLFNIFFNGTSGVDFFFVLSGFIMYYIHSKDFGNSTKFNSFVYKRLVRVYPIHWVAAAFMLTVFLVFNYGDGVVNNPSTIIKSFLLLPQEVHLNGVIWTLTHEIYFYLMFSLALLLNRKISSVILTGWIFISLFHFLGFFSLDNFYFSFIFSKFNLEFALGCLAGYLVLNFKLSKRNLILSLGLSLMLMIWVLEYNDLFVIDRILAYGIPYTLIIIGGASIAYNKELRLPRSLTFLGDASYSIYLSHLIFLKGFTSVFVVLGINNYIGNTNTMNLTILLTLISCCYFYILIEKPLIKISRIKSNKNKESKLPKVS